MLNAHKAACLTATRIFQTPRPVRRDLYRINPHGQFAQFMGCECATITPLVMGIDDARIRVTTSCPLHGVHPDQVQAYA